MMLNVSNALKNPGQAYELEMAFSFEPVEIMGDEVSFSGVSLKGELMGAEETVSVNGKLTAQAHSLCANCLSPVTLDIRADLNAEFERGADGLDAYPLEGHEIDLESAVREALLLALPMRFLCRRDCKGLCPTCGRNRNTDPCTCREGGRADNPFSALSSLISDHNDEEV